MAAVRFAEIIGTANSNASIPVISGSTNGNSAELDTTYLRRKAFHVTTTGFSGTLDLKGSYDGGTTWFNVQYFARGTISTPATAQLSYAVDTAVYVYIVDDHIPLMRVEMTRSAGSVVVRYFANENASDLNEHRRSVDTELPAAAALADATANPTAPAVGAHLLVWNGTTWDRMLGVNTGQIRASLYTTSGTLLQSSAPGDSLAGNAVYLQTTAHPHLYDPNGNTWQRQRNNHEVTLLASAARTTTQTVALTNYNARMGYIVIDVTTMPSGGLTLAVQGKDSLSGKFFALSGALTKITGTGTYVYFFGPGSAAAAAGGVTASSGFPIPRVGQLTVTVDDATSITYSVAVNYIN